MGRRWMKQRSTFYTRDNVDEDEQEYHSKTHSLHISRKAINMYGTTEGCPACSTINKRGHTTGRIGYNHSTVCRQRIGAEMQIEFEYRRLMHKHEVHQEAGRYFFHEHPAGASSWRENCIQTLLSKHGVTSVNGDQCRYGLVATDNGYIGPARKSTGVMTNSPCIAKSFGKRCENTTHKKAHEPVLLTNGRAKAAQVYPQQCAGPCAEA